MEMLGMEDVGPNVGMKIVGGRGDVGGCWVRGTR